MSPNRLALHGPTRRTLQSGESIDWHDHAVNQLCYPLRGVLAISTPLGVWMVPPHRAVWIPAHVPHAHRAHGPTEMRTLIFAADVDPLRTDRPTVVAADPLLREVIKALSQDQDHDGFPAPASRTSAPDPASVGRFAAASHPASASHPAAASHPAPKLHPAAAPLDARQRHNLEQVALDRLRRVEELPLSLPAPRDDRLRAVAALLTADPADQRSLADLGRAVGAAERTLSRLFRAETGLTFPQWRAQLRLQHALTLLAAGQPVTSVAVACGFHTPSAFIEAFRKAFGTTPGKYWTAET